MQVEVRVRQTSAQRAAQHQTAHVVREHDDIQAFFVELKVQRLHTKMHRHMLEPDYAPHKHNSYLLIGPVLLQLKLRDWKLRWR